MASSHSRFAWIAFLAVLLAPLAAAGTIDWKPSLDAALADAKARNVPILIAVNMDGERANDEMVNVHYKNARIVDLAKRLACLFASVEDHAGDKACTRCGGPVTCTEHQTIEKAVRAKYLKAAVGGAYVAPEHVILKPDGTILLSVPYRVSVGELEWCLVSAIRTIDPAFEWKLAEDAKPPRRLVNGGVAESELTTSLKPPTKKEVDEILDELHKSKKWFDKLDLLAKLMRSSDKRAIEFFESFMSGKFPNREEGITQLLRSIGSTSPPEYAPLVQPFLDDDRAPVRCEAIVALELLANPKALPSLTKAWKKEKDPAFQKHLIRAVAACGPKDPATEKLVLEQIDGATDPVVATNAMLACEYLSNKQKAVGAAERGLSHPKVPGVRLAAAYVLALHLDPGKKPLIESAAAVESVAKIKEGLTLAVEVFNGTKSPRDLEKLVEQVAEIGIPRQRY